MRKTIKINSLLCIDFTLKKKSRIRSSFSKNSNSKPTNFIHDIFIAFQMHSVMNLSFLHILFVMNNVQVTKYNCQMQILIEIYSRKSNSGRYASQFERKKKFKCRNWMILQCQLIQLMFKLKIKCHCQYV